MMRVLIMLSILGVLLMGCGNDQFRQTGSVYPAPGPSPYYNQPAGYGQGPYGPGGGPYGPGPGPVRVQPVPVPVYVPVPVPAGGGCDCNSCCF